MAVIIIDNRTVWHECDVADWSGAESDSLYTSAPDPKDLSGCLGFSISEQENYAYYIGSSTDLTSTLIYVWMLVLGTEEPIASGGRQICIGDSTPDVRGYYVGGSDASGFRHDSGTVNWQCFLLDTANLPSFTQHQGGAPTFTTIDRIGIAFNVTSKALGGGDNCFVDIIFYGNDGLSIVGGTTGDRGTFSEIADTDAGDVDWGTPSSGSAGGSYGVVRELASGVYGLQGSLTFGDSAAGGDCYFDDDGSVIVFENKITSAYWYFDAEGTGGQTNVFNLSNATIKSAGPIITCDFSGGNINTLTFDNVAFVDLVGAITFSNSADATGHSVINGSFQNCGQIDPGDVTFQDNTISSTTDADGGLLIDVDGTTNISGLSFVSDGTGHAIHVSVAGSYTFTNFTYSGYGSTGTSDAAVLNDTGGVVNITISDGDSPTYYNVGGGSVTNLIASVPLKVKVIDSAGDPIENVQTAVYTSSDDIEHMNEDTLATGLAEDTYSGSTPAACYIRCRKSSIGDTRYINNSAVGTIAAGSGLDVTITMRTEPLV